MRALRSAGGITAFGSAALFLAVWLQAAPTPPQPVELLKKTVVVLNRFDEMRTFYTYRRTERTKDFDKSGALESTHSSVVEVLYLSDKHYDHVLERDGKPLSGSEAKKEQAKFEKAAHEADQLTPGERVERRAKILRERQQRTEYWKYIPQAYQLKLLPDVVLAGRPAYVVDLKPKPEYRGKYANLLHNARATLFIDQQDSMLVRMDAEILDDVSFGFFLGRLNKGSRIHLVMSRINNEVWLPKTVESYFSGRELFKTLRHEEDLSFGDYQKYRTDAQAIVDAPAK